MAEVYLDIYGKCTSICPCDKVALEMTDTWTARIPSGIAIAQGVVISKGSYVVPRAPYTNQTLCCTTYTGGCCPPSINPCTCCQPPVVTNCDMCVFQVKVDTSQFSVDPATGTNYIPTCTDIVDIAPYYGIISKLITAIGAP